MSHPHRYQDLPKGVERALSHALQTLAVPLVTLTRTQNRYALTWMSPGATAVLSPLGEASGLSPAVKARVATQLAEAVIDEFDSDNVSADLAELGIETTLDVGNGGKVPARLAAIPLHDDEETFLVELLERGSSRRVIAAVRDAEERFERLVETLDSCVWILRQRHVIYANPASAELLSVERNRLIGVDFAEFCLPEDVPVFVQNLERVERGEVVSPYEYRVVAKDGRQLIVELSSVALEYDGGRAVLSFGRDVTLRKRAERSRLQADRLSALGLLAGGMAHALNNPLTYVVLNLDHVLRRLPVLAYDSAGLADILACLEEAREGAERMATIVKRMRSFARTDESSTKTLDLRHVLESVVELVGHEIHHRGRLTTHFEDVPQVVANESKLEQICLGLLLFAAQMLPDDAPQRHAVRLSLQTDERHFAVLEIVCEGCKLDASNVERLFDPFAQGDEPNAKGFGLSVCSSLVEQLGGHLVAEPLPGTGLLLRTTIPCVSVPRPSESNLTSRPTSAFPGSHRGRARILLVDDDPGVGRALRQLLEGEHDVKCFDSPQAALQELLGDSSYDLVFCDLMMPKLSGMDLFEVLRYNRSGYEARIIFMTGGAFTPAAARFLAQVPNQRIEKPFNLPVLQRILQRAIRKHD